MAQTKHPLFSTIMSSTRKQTDTYKVVGPHGYLSEENDVDALDDWNITTLKSKIKGLVSKGEEQRQLRMVHPAEYERGYWFGQDNQPVTVTTLERVNEMNSEAERMAFCAGFAATRPLVVKEDVDPNTCAKCKAFFSKYQCNASRGECDCPKCQGMCKCPPTSPSSASSVQEVYKDKHGVVFRSKAGWNARKPGYVKSEPWQRAPKPEPTPNSPTQTPSTQSGVKKEAADYKNWMWKVTEQGEQPKMVCGDCCAELTKHVWGATLLHVPVNAPTTCAICRVSIKPARPMAEDDTSSQPEPGWTCPTCKGTGKDPSGQKICPKCFGYGISLTKITEESARASGDALRRKYKDNENKNFHLENDLLLVQTFGTPDEIQFVERMMLQHTGPQKPSHKHTSDDPQVKRLKAIHQKYYPQLTKLSEATMAPYQIPNDIMASAKKYAHESNRPVYITRMGDDWSIEPSYPALECTRVMPNGTTEFLPDSRTKSTKLTPGEWTGD